MQYTHEVNPLHAYNVEGNLMKPIHYARDLPGALVVVHFYLRHYLIKKTGSPTQNVFVGELARIRVIAAPVKIPKAVMPGPPPFVAFLDVTPPRK